MTTTRPVPEHGTYARANGSPGYREPCTCRKCVPARRARKKVQRVNRQLGRPTRIDATLARQRLLQLNKTMGWVDIAEAMGGSAAHIRSIANGRQPSIAVSTHNRIMAVRQGLTGGQYIDATGSIRRVRALTYLGHTLDSIAAAANAHTSRIQPIAAGHPKLRRFLAQRITEAYRQLSETQGTSARSRNRALTQGWAPPAAWDDERLDDPSANPEWTGHCGTDRGWWMHTTQRLPMCQPCEAAHEQWKAVHRTLPRNEYWAALGRARAAASRRGTDLAHDGRELMRVSGLGYEQAAERLGVTRQHLQQELVRHPAGEAEAA